MNLRTIPAGVPFLPTLATLWRDQAAALGRPLHEGLILLPTRRAARALAAAFLDQALGAPLLLPRIATIGGLDEAPLALAGALDLPPAVSEVHRRALLAQLILEQGGAGAPDRADTAWLFAGDLAALMDEAERAEVDLRQALHKAADADYAEHWNKTLAFLEIVTAQWPARLADYAMMNPAARQVALLHAQTEAWQDTPPDHPVLVVGNAGDIPAVGKLLRVVARLPCGCVVLPGLDLHAPPAVWDALDEAHPQYALATLLHQIGATRGDVVAYPSGARSARAGLLARALLPAACLGAWQHPAAPDHAGLTRLAPADAQDEAVCIALILRDALQTPTIQAALVTPDRALAQRVAVELGRWGVVADDSAGETLARTPPAVFLRLIAAAVAANLAPVPLLAVLKHPLAAAGLAPAELRAQARTLESTCLRGPAPPPGLPGLRRAVHGATGTDSLAADAPPHPLAALLTRLERCLEPLLREAGAVRTPPATLLLALVGAAEALAATDDTPGPARLWAAEEGEALATVLADALDALSALPADTPRCLPMLLDALLDGAVVRGRRAIRGLGTAEHPRVFIWGLLEARLQSADVIVLGGLAEGVWPAATDPGPWMSRPMRTRAGLPSAELRVGQAAHDFCMAACAAPSVILSAPRRRESAPAVPSRWLTRIAAMLGEPGLAPHPAVGWAAQLDLPANGVDPADPPRPCPPLAARPRRLAVTDIAVLKRNPYEVYARRILGLRALDPLEQSTDFMDYGNIVHHGLDRYLSRVGVVWPADAARVLAAQLELSLREAGIRPALIAWWLPRLQRIAAWVDREEQTRRAARPLASLVTEATGEWVLHRPGGSFTLRGRADRIERRTDGTLAILDYKTGTVPTEQAVMEGWEPQLPLEALMAQAGAFGPALQAPVAELAYWRLSGGDKPGERRLLLARAADPAASLAIIIGTAGEELVGLIDFYDQPHTAYPAQPVKTRGRTQPYAHLARAAEWGGSGDEDPGDGDADDEAPL